MTPVPRGRKRRFVKCNTCGGAAYYDFTPYSFENPVMTLPCGHGVTLRFDDSVTGLTEKEFIDQQKQIKAG